MSGRLRRDLVVFAVFAVVVILANGQISQYNQTLGVKLFMLAAAAQAWNLIGGYAGQFSLGQHMFIGMGAYTTAVMLREFTSLPLWVAVLTAGVLSAGFAALVSIPLLRLRDVYFSVGTLGVALAMQAWMINWEFTGQTQALALENRAFMMFDRQYYWAAALMLATTLTVLVIARTRFGMRLQAVRDDEDAAAELGVNAFMNKMLAFTISAFFTGIAGAVFALQKMTLDPGSAFTMEFTVNMVIMAVIGGLATVNGPLLGAALVFVLQQKLQDYGVWSTLITGVILIGVIRVMPGGIWGFILSLVARLRTRGAGGPPPEPEPAAAS